MGEPERKQLTPSERAATQGGVLTRAQLEGFLGTAGVRRALRAGAWQLVHRGTYAERAVRDAARSDPLLEHRLQCAARCQLTTRDLVVSHSSAALLHGLRLLDRYAGPPQLTLVRPPGASPPHERLPLAAAVPAAHRELLDGLPITTRPRTVADLARTSAREAAVVMADAALRSGIDRIAVRDVLAACRGWPG